jgi:hypothetical protein
VSQGIIRGDEQITGLQKVWGAAAWTYVAAAVSAIGAWLFYLFVLFFRGRSATARICSNAAMPTFVRSMAYRPPNKRLKKPPRLRGWSLDSA